MKKPDQTEQDIHVHKLTEREIKASITEAIEEFSSFVAILHRRFASQLPHDLIGNAPRGLVQFDLLPKHAARVALVAAIGEYLSWDEKDAATFAAEILEDCNIHDLAKLIHQKIEDGND